jgi:hypothetical protein
VFVGLDDIAEGKIGWSSRYVSSGGRPEWLQIMNLGLRGSGEWNFIMSSNEGIDTLIVDGCYFLSAIKADGSLHQHVSGWHLDDWGTLVIKDQQNRGRTPSDPAALFREHNYYFKSGEIVSWVVGNDFNGGNRTAFQFRPGADDPGNKMPTHDIIIANNTCNGYGWQYDDGTGGSVGGGAALTVWSAPPGDVFVYNNEVLDARYMCLMIGAQGPARDWYNENGYITTNAYIADNRFSNARATRSTVALAAIENVYIWGSNELRDGGNWDMLSEWHYERHGIDNGSVFLLDGPMVGENFDTYDPAQDRMVPVDEDTLNSWRVDVPIPAGPGR